MLIVPESEPAFSVEAEGGIDLVCSNCKNFVLIRRFRPENFLSIRIKCPKCGNIHETSGVPAGEILPKSLLNLDEVWQYGTVENDKRAFINRTILVPPTLAVALDGAIRKTIETNYPRKVSPLQMTLGKEFVETSKDEFRRVAGHNFDRRIARAERARQHRNSLAGKDPFPWACAHLHHRLVEDYDSVLHTNADIWAVNVLTTFGHVVDVWSHHPRFLDLARTFTEQGHYHHNIAQLIYAASCWENGVGVGLALPETEGERTADLYVRTMVGERFPIEVKAPQAFFYPNINLQSVDSVTNTILDAVRSARGQISATNKGIVLIAAQEICPGFKDLFYQGLSKASQLTSRQNVAGISGILQEFPLYNSVSRKIPGSSFSYQNYANPNFPGENPFFYADTK